MSTAFQRKAHERLRAYVARWGETPSFMPEHVPPAVAHVLSVVDVLHPQAMAQAAQIATKLGQKLNARENLEKFWAVAMDRHRRWCPIKREREGSFRWTP